MSRTAMVRGDAVMADHALPAGFDPASTSWTVTLRFQGREISTPYFMGSAITRDPSAREVLDSLLLDARVGDSTFEGFCADFGYDTDSRKAYATWEECRRTEPKLRRFLGDEYEAATADPETWLDAHTERSN